MDTYCLDPGCRRLRHRDLRAERRLAREWIIRMGFVSFLAGIIVGLLGMKLLLGVQ